MVLMVFIILAASAYFISGLSINQVKVDQNIQTRITLKKAKQALLAYAITHADRAGEEGELGFLPCPDVNNDVPAVEGNQDINCSGRYINSIGYFPWKSLDVSVHADDSGTCLMYAVSGAYKLNTSSNMLNEDTNGMFQVVDDANPANVLIGNNPEDRVVAIVFAPDVSLAGQTRTFDNTSLCGRNYEIAGVAVNNYISEFLEGNGVTDNGILNGAADTLDEFIHATSTSDTELTPYNDQFITITRDEVWAAILARNDFDDKMENLTEALALCLSNYATANVGNRLPWVAPMSLADYRLKDNYDDSDGASGYAGRFPFTVDDSNGVIDATIPTDVLFDVTGCNALAVGSGTTAATADLVDPGDSGLPGSPTEYRKLWNNWKDHFFYVVSKDYEPEVASNPDDEAAVDAANAAATAAAAAASAANAVVASANIIKDATAEAAAALASGDTAAATTFADAAVSEATIIAVKEVTATDAATAAAAAAVAATAAAAVAGVDPDVATETLAAAAAATAAANAATDAATAAGKAGLAATKVEAFVSLNKIPQTADWADKAADAATDAAVAAADADAAELAAANAAAAAAAAAGTAPASCALNCIQVNSAERAGVVIFAGSRQDALAQLRTGPVWLGIDPDLNTKHQILNYLENGNEGVFPDISGNGSYVTGGNDVMFCIETDMSVIKCL